MAEPDIPVTFLFRGENHSGHLTRIGGGGDSFVWQLMVAGFYYGRLRLSRFDGNWMFDENNGTKGLTDLAEYFGEVVTAWYE